MSDGSFLQRARGLWTLSRTVALASALSAGVATTLLTVVIDENLEWAVEEAVGDSVLGMASSMASHPALTSNELEVRRTEAGASSLRLFDTDGALVGEAGRWHTPVPEGFDVRASAWLLPSYEVESRTEEVVYQAAFAPLPGGQVLGLERAVDMEAVEQLEWLQFAFSVAMVILAGLLGLVLGWVVTTPLRKLEVTLRTAQPGDSPSSVPIAGPREAEAIAWGARRLLEAVRERDVAVAEAHERDLRRLSRMSAEVAHEVRNPLSTLALTLRRVIKAEEAAKRAALGVAAQEQLDHLEVIVQRLLDLNRPIEPCLEALEVVVLAQTLAASDPRITVDGSESARATADAVLVNEILTNLVRNAFEAGASSVVLEVRTKDGGIHVDVRDDGEGLEGDVEELFEWFHTTRAQGSGLGLSISRRLAVAQTGTLECVRPRPATFRLTLPSAP